MLNNVVRVVFLTNPVTKRYRRSEFFHSYTSKLKRNPVAVNVQVYDFYQCSIWTKRLPTQILKHSDPFYKFLNGQKLARIRLFFTCDRRNHEVFELQNRTAICKRICAFPLNVAFILCGPCKEHSEKEVSRKNNEGKWYGVRVVKTPLMVLFNKSPFRILPVYQILVNAMNGLFWQLL